MAENTDKEAVARPIVTERVVTREVSEPPLGPNAKTDPEDPAAWFTTTPEGKKVNAWGEEKGSPEDKKRFS